MKNLINRVMSREQSMLNIKLASVLFLISLLAACGGGGAIGETKPGFGQGESDGSGANPNSPQTLGSNTFFPLNFYYSGEGYVEKDEMEDRKSTRLNSSHVRISYAVFCLKKKKKKEMKLAFSIIKQTVKLQRIFGVNIVYETGIKRSVFELYVFVLTICSCTMMVSIEGRM